MSLISQLSLVVESLCLSVQMSGLLEPKWPHICLFCISITMIVARRGTALFHPLCTLTNTYGYIRKKELD